MFEKLFILSSQDEKIIKVFLHREMKRLIKLFYRDFNIFKWGY